MNKNIIMAIVSLLLLPSVMITSVSGSDSIVVTSGETIYVDDEYNSSTPGWGIDHFNVIQDAIDNVTSGDTVFVYNGIYYETVVIDVENICLIGENKENTIINGSGKNHVIAIYADNTKISNFTVMNSSKDDCFDAGIYATSKNNVFTNNVILENLNGVITHASEAYTEMLNTIKNNILTNNVYAIRLRDSSKNIITDNHILSNDIGIKTINCKENSIKRNIIKNNNIGLDLTGASFIVSNNIISNNSKGIYICGSENNFFNNIISKNSKGVHVHGYDHNRFEKNEFINNDCGIHLQGVAGHQPYAYRNIIIKNNFINNSNHAETFNFQIWFRNYWDDWNGLDYYFYIFSPYWLSKIFPYTNVDLLPAKEPYDIDT